ncbi:hypothetical protein [Dactylosporangium sp. CA-139066]|uniref:hypothetical protein n=1 Tax=Dactylosporangium sp. CA-139066 TaxID=3239930 RepID=UPI003D8B27F5
MTGPQLSAARRLEAWIPRVALVVLPAVWGVLAATLPTSTDRDLTIDVFCTTGNPVVGVWIESQSGGSGFAQPGEPGTAAVIRYTFRQQFTGRYQARVGCGGNRQQWGLSVSSSFSDRTYRRLACNDADADTARSAGCRDQPA